AGRLQSRFTAVVIADANGLGDIVNENLAVSNLSRASGARQHFNDLLGAAGWNHHLHLEFGEQVDVVFLAAIDLRMSLLTPMAAHLADGHAVNAEPLEALLYLVQLEGLNDSFDFF